MSMSENGQFVICDGEGCVAKAPAPVSAQTVHLAKEDRNTGSAEGWLFVSSGYASCHYCPQCKEWYLPLLSSGEPIGSS